MSATYSKGGQDQGRGISKLVSSTNTLSFGDRETFVAGMNDVTAKPVLRMVDEFRREFTWRDWKGVNYSLLEEWQYVNGPAKDDACTSGIRDEHNVGKIPEDFLAGVNHYIMAHRSVGFGVHLPEEHAYLTRHEVLAVRLFSGPAYQPINMFLRQISKLTGEYRTAMSAHARLTFAATVGHLVKAIRKLAAVASAEETSRLVFRGMRGELPKGFWVPDATGVVCAVDASFMSVSKFRGAPIAYMGPGPNVLWAIHQSPQSDAGYHSGADISMLSQFANEEELLFPPCTMLTVLPPSSADNFAQAAERETAAFEERIEDEKRFIMVSVMPTFV